MYLSHPSRTCAALLIAALLLSLPGAPEAQSSPRIQEVLYDGVGADADKVFTELWGPPGMSLDGWQLIGINGDTRTPYRTVSLTGAVFPEDGLLVVATAEAAEPLRSRRDFTGLVDWQNGPDAVQLLDPDGQVVDALQYGDAGAFNAGEGTPAPQTASGQSLSRDLLGSDTGDNAADFAIADPPTPGAGRSSAATPPTDSLEISLPDTSAAPGDSLVVPVRLGETAGLKIVAIELAISYDGDLLTTGTVSTAPGLLSSGWSLARRVSPGTQGTTDTLKIALATALDTLTGAGQLLAIHFAVADHRQPASSPLTIEKVLFNTGATQPLLRHGRFLLTGADGSLTLAPDRLLPPDTLTATVADPDENRDPDWPDRIALVLTAAGQVDTLIAVESGPNTGAFIGAIPVVSGTPAAGNGRIELPPDSAVTACYQDLLTTTGQQKRRCATVQYRPGRDGELAITRVLQPGDTLRVRLVDPDLNLDPAGRDIASVTAGNQTTGEAEPLLLMEAGLDDSVFFGVLATVPVEGPSGDGLLGIRRGDLLRVRFVDSRSSAGISREVIAPALAIGYFGDADGNDRVQAFDAARVLAHVLSPLLTGLDSLAANVDSLAPDSRITPYDAALILQHRVGLRRRFPVQMAGSGNQPQPVSRPKPIPETRQLTVQAEPDYLAVRLDTREAILSGELLLEGVWGRVELPPEMRHFALASRPEARGTRTVLAGPEPVSGPGELLRVYPGDPRQGTLRVQGDFNDGRIIGYSPPSTAALAPPAFILFPNHPNPFNPETTIRFALPRAVPVSLEIFDALGRQVRTLVDAHRPAGIHQLIWDGRDQRGVRTGSGVYFLRLQAGDFTQTRRMLLIE